MRARPGDDHSGGHPKPFIMVDTTIAHGSVTRIAAVAADITSAAGDGCIKSQSHPSVGGYNRLEPIAC